PALTQNHGAVINLLTLVALASMPRFGVYNASKAAAWSMTQSLRAKLGRQGVKVFNVFPGAVCTDLLKGVEITEPLQRAVADEVLAGIEADTEDIFPDATSKQVYSYWAEDHKSIERQFADM